MSARTSSAADRNDVPDPVRSAAEALASACDALEGDRAVVLVVRGRTRTVRVAVSAPDPDPDVPRLHRALTRCERDVLRLLAGEPGRLTASRVCDRLTGSLEHGDTTVRHALVRLAHAGLVESRRRAPAGYAITPAGLRSLRLPVDAKSNRQ